MVRQLVKVVIAHGVRVVFLLLAVTVISFSLLALSPIDPIDAYFGGNAISEEQRAAVAAYWQYDQPPITRYLHWLSNIVQGNWGDSIIYNEPVLTVISSKFQSSLLLMGTAWILSGVFGFSLGVLSGAKEGSVFDTIIKGYSFFCASAPLFWVGLLILMLFAVELRWFPFALGTPIGKNIAEVTIWERLHHLVLPAITLSIGVATITMHTRQKMIQALESNYMLFAKARGETLWQRVRHHGIRNVLIPFVTIQFATFNELFSGTILVETVFAYPGLGGTVTLAGLRGDVSLLLGIALISALFVFSGNLIANILYVIINPQMTEGVKET